MKEYNIIYTKNREDYDRYYCEYNGVRTYNVVVEAKNKKEVKENIYAVIPKRAVVIDIEDWGKVED